MDICKNLNTITHFNKSVLTIGSFDGMHCGHIEIIKELIKKAGKNKCPSIVITFNPHPKCILHKGGDEILNVLMDINKKLDIFEQYQIDYVWLIPFDEDFAQISADKFLDSYIMKYFNPTDIVVGYDHHFGHKRKGDARFLNNEKARYNYNLYVKDPITIDNMPVNSTLIRNDISRGKLEAANNYLGWDYELCGRVVKGKGLGKDVKFPTANIEPNFDNQLIPAKGVYCVDVIIENQFYLGMCNIGVRPTFYTNGDKVIEVHLISDEELNLYDKDIKIIFKKFIREEKKYKSAADLTHQLKLDRNVCLTV